MMRDMRTVRLIVAAVFLLLGLAEGARGAGLAEEAIPLPDRASCAVMWPDVAPLPGGGSVAIWTGSADSAAPRDRRVFARIFDGTGLPRGPEIAASPGLTGPVLNSPFMADIPEVAPAVAANAEGTFLVVWGDMIRGTEAQLFDVSGRPIGGVIVLTQEFPESGLAVTDETDGGFAVFAGIGPLSYLWRYTARGEPRGERRKVTDLSDITFPGGGEQWFLDPAVTSLGSSGLALAWDLVAFTEDPGGDVFGVVEAIALAPSGTPPAVPELSESTIGQRSFQQPAIAASPAGAVLVVWRELGELGPVLKARLMDKAGTPLGDSFRVDEGDSHSLSAPDVAVDRSGEFLVAWREQPVDGGPTLSRRKISATGALEPIQRIPSTLGGLDSFAMALDDRDRLTVVWGEGQPLHAPLRTCGDSKLYVSRFDLSSTDLHLQGGRFQVGVRWTDHAGQTGEGHAVPLTGDSGYFWFFGPENVELLVKVLDGRGVNGSFWVFYGSLSDVAYTLTVTDTLTGRTKSYDNPAGTLASRADTTAFPPTAATSAAAAGATAAAAGLSQDLPAALDATAAAGPCTDPGPSETRRPGLCLGDRFEVEVSWQAAGQTGAGQGVRLTRDSGYLWFFGPNNAELIVKVLDGRAVNGHFWVFYGALSDVDYTLSVHDTVTGIDRTYHNPAGQLASRADTEAF